MSWEIQHVETRLRGLEANDDIADTLANLINYSSGTLNETAVSYRNKFYNSYKAYAEYYYRIGDFDRSVQMANLAFRFHVAEDSLLDTGYNSLLRITTEKEQIPVMKILLTKNKYKEQIIKRLYPMLLSLNKKKKLSIESMSSLILRKESGSSCRRIEKSKNRKSKNLSTIFKY